MFGVPGGKPVAPASVNEWIPSFGSDAPANVMESPDPLKVKVRLAAFGSKNDPEIGVVLWLNVKSGVTPPGNEPKPVVAMRSDPGVLPERLLGNVNVLMLPSL